MTQFNTPIVYRGEILTKELGKYGKSYWYAEKLGLKFKEYHQITSMIDQIKEGPIKFEVVDETGSSGSSELAKVKLKIIELAKSITICEPYMIGLYTENLTSYIDRLQELQRTK